VDELAARVRAALDGDDLEALAELLAPDVTWGPGEGGDGCSNRRQVLRWWAKGATPAAGPP